MKYDDEIAGITKRVGKVVTLKTLERAGLPAHLLKLGIRAGWKRLLPGVWLTANEEPTFDQWLQAGLFYYGPNAAIGGEAALHHYGLVSNPPQEIEIWVHPTRSLARPKGSRFKPRRDHGTRISSANHDLGLVSPAVALADYLNTTVDQLDAAAKTIMFRKTFPGLADNAVATIAERRGQKHRVMARDLLTCTPPFDSVLEFGWVQQIEQAHGIEAAQRQWRGPQGFIWDGVWHHLHHTLELDGLAHHSGTDAVSRDSRKDRAAISAGYIPLHYGYSDVFHQPCMTTLNLLKLVPGLKGGHGCRRGCPVGVMVRN